MAEKIAVLALMAEQAGVIAAALKAKDKGGPSSILAFRTLVIGLKKAFERATGRPAKVTWNEHRSRYEGLFLSLLKRYYRWPCYSVMRQTG